MKTTTPPLVFLLLVFLLVVAWAFAALALALLARQPAWYLVQTAWKALR